MQTQIREGGQGAGEKSLTPLIMAVQSLEKDSSVEKRLCDALELL